MRCSVVVAVSCLGLLALAGCATTSPPPQNLPSSLRLTFPDDINVLLGRWDGEVHVQNDPFGPKRTLIVLQITRHNESWIGKGRWGSRGSAANDVEINIGLVKGQPVMKFFTNYKTRVDLNLTRADTLQGTFEPYAGIGPQIIAPIRLVRPSVSRTRVEFDTVPGAQLFLLPSPHPIEADAQGRARLFLEPGPHEVTIIKEGMESRKYETHVAPGQTDLRVAASLTQKATPPAPASRVPAPGLSDYDPPIIVLNYPPEAATVDQESIVVLGLVTDAVAVEQVLISVNGKLVAMSADSSMTPRSRPIRTPAALQPGQNVIEVTAVDKAGNASQLVRTITRVGPLATTPTAPSPPASDWWAVVIGIGQYDHRDIPPLKYSVADAEAVYRTLIGPGGFKKDNVLLLTDRTERKPTLKNMKYALGTFLSRAAKRDDTVLIFFAGHGAPESDARSLERDGLAKYLIPSDADPDDLFSTALPMDDLQAIFGRIESERVVAFLDACYSGAAGGRTFTAKRTRSGSLDDLFLERLTRSKGRAIVTAARPSDVSIELADLGHGVFTYYLVEGLKGAADVNRDGIVTLHELYEYLEQQVTAKSRSVGSTHHPVMKGEVEGALPLSKVPTR